MQTTQLKKYRQNRGLTQINIAEICGISLRYFQFLEAGQRKPSLTTARKLAKVLGTTVEELFPI